MIAVDGGLLCSVQKAAQAAWSVAKPFEITNHAAINQKYHHHRMRRMLRLE
jgi:hypothetical protein